MNPYNCTLPGHLFVGYNTLREELRADLRQGKSFAVLGGRRCGKTSLLLQVEKDLQTLGLPGFHPLPRFLDLQGMGQVTVPHLFKTLYRLVTQGTGAPPWVPGQPGDEYEDFLDALEAAQPAMTKCHGPGWLAVLLVDELDAAVAKLPDDQFFQNLRNLLMVSRFHRHFRLVASGVKEMNRLIASGSSPLNNLCHVHLRAFKQEEALQLTVVGFPDGLGADAENALFETTGRHPYLLQGLLDRLWSRSGPVCRETVEQAGEEFLSAHKDFRRWLDGFGPGELAVYEILAEAPNGGLTEESLRTSLKRSLLPDLEEAITTLGFHGLIDDSEPGRLRIAGTLFLSWWRQQTPARTLAGPTRAEILSNLLGNKAETVLKQEPRASTPPVTVDSGWASRTVRPIPPVIPDHVVVGDRPFGGGAYGRVWLARNIIGTYRAVKVVAFDAFPEARPFERELKGLQKYEPLSRAHPGLVQILQIGRNDAAGYFYYVMELADDERAAGSVQPSDYSPRNLAREIARRGRLPVLECVTLGLALTSALGFLHQSGLVHRDIKPANIIFVQGAPKLADIGLVTDLGRTDGAASWVGTRGYLAPEGPGTAAADLYGLGKLLYQACTGFDCDRFPTLPADGPAEAWPGACARFCEIAAQACHADPAERYPTAAALQHDLERFRDAIAPAVR